MRSRKRHLVLATVLTLLGAFLLYTWILASCKKSSRLKRDAEDEVRMLRAGLTILFCWKCDDPKFAELIGKPIEPKMLKDLLLTPREVILVPSFEFRCVRSEGFIDPWGSGYRGLVRKEGDLLRCSVWSAGPNGRDEDMKGDDIADEWLGRP